MNMLIQFCFQHGGCSSCLCLGGRQEWPMCVCVWGDCWQLTASLGKRVSGGQEGTFQD